MIRLIYQHPFEGYQTMDSEKDATLIAHQCVLNDHFLPIICVVDYKRRSIFNRSEDYKQHRDLIDELIFDPKYVSTY